MPDGALRGLPKIVGRRDNLIATSAPTVSDDIRRGYLPGSLWLNVTTQVYYVARSVASGAATWLEVATHPLTPVLIVLATTNGGTSFFADADIPRIGWGMITDVIGAGNSGSGIIQWYRGGSFNLCLGVSTNSTGGTAPFGFRGTTLSSTTTPAFSCFIEGNSAGHRLGIKNNAGFARDLHLWVLNPDAPISLAR